MDQERFQAACGAVINQARERKGIGTLSEKTLHAVLKHYFDPCMENHETKIGPYVADIVGEDGIIEIQTGSFNQMRKKLEVFLSVERVTVVYPIARTRWLTWVDPETGALSAKRKSPKQGSRYQAFFELYRIKQLLTHKNLDLCIVMLDMEEYRFLNGWDAKRKRGASRMERIPLALIDEIRITSSQDYIKLIPLTVPPLFTTRDYAAAAGVHLAQAQTALNVLHYVGCVRRTGKQGGLWEYEIVRDETIESQMA
ncbi:MAG: hypothetical protein LBV27_04625 [Oscillospiraceae bacterium]|jgi:hypothetical protein|nr:hypothetical protein [Oscillospiraceae bacterium]